MAAVTGGAAGPDARVCAAKVGSQQGSDYYLTFKDILHQARFQRLAFHDFAIRSAVDEWLNAHRRSIKAEAAASEQRIDDQASAIIRWASWIIVNR